VISNELPARTTLSGRSAHDRLTWLDARETLAQFMDGVLPDSGRFRACLGRVLEESRSGREHLTIRAFGEMVDLLLQDGNPEGALRLEQLWNELGHDYGFSLLCGYNIGNLYREEHWRYFQKICDQHNRSAEQKNGDPSQRSGIFKSVCCGAEIVIATGTRFPACPNHPRLTTFWKHIKDDRHKRSA